jgi:hypothetical protein
MKRNQVVRISSLVAAVVLSLGALAGVSGCKSTGAPSSAFGVNITVDASALSVSDRKGVLKGQLVVTGAQTLTTSFPVPQAAIQSGSLRFHFDPDATKVQAGSKLTFEFDALGTADAVISSGKSAELTLEATAVDATIILGHPGGGTGGAGGAGGAAGGGGAGGNRSTGSACTSDGDCGSGFCTDGLCCDTRCNDVCATCKDPAHKGECTSYAADTDPENECGPKLPPTAPDTDAGASTGGASGAAGAASGGTGGASGSAGGATDASSTDAPISDAATVGSDDAAVINTPPGGFMSMPKVCGGACNGQRACKFPDATKSCGKSFCNTKKEVASFACDGNGGCNISLTGCTDYTCDDTKGACRTNCGTHADCQLGEYCNGLTNMCVPKKVLGIACGTDAECRLEHCSSGVCCNTQCDAPFACNSAGAAGQCKCPACTTGACQVFYRDSDADGFGVVVDKSTLLADAIAAGSAKAGCANVPPQGYVADSTDCDDKDPAVHPGQTVPSATKSLGVGTFDFNCDGKTTKETPEYVGGSCKFCGAVGTCDQTTTTCTSAGASSSFQCPQELLRAILAAGAPTWSELASPATASLQSPSPGGESLAPAAGVVPPPVIVPPPICRVCALQCCGCNAQDKTGFVAPVNCGATAQVFTCGTCAAAGGGPAVTQAPRVQRCL